jgi:peptidyl-tRNA hydrolase
VIRSIKTKDFIRVRIGIAPTTPSGKLKKPQGEKAVLDFLMSPFSKKEEQEIDAIFGRVSEALSLIAQDDIARAMNQFN